MHRVRPARIVLALFVLAVVATATFIVAVSAADPAPSLVAQAATAPAGSAAASAIASPVAIPTAPVGSVVSGTASAPSPAALATAGAASAVAPPSSPPPVPQVADTGGGIDRGALIETLIGVGAAIVLVGLGAWGLIRLIATA